MAGTAALDPHAALDYLLMVGRIKKTKRTGWIENGVPVAQVESVGDHSHRMALFTLLNKDPEVDTDRLVKVALMHDVAESLIGDISPKQMRQWGMTKDDKYKKERAAMEEIAASLKDPQLTPRLVEYWEEYEQLKTKEALWMKDIDYLEMVIQAFQYEQDFHVDLTGFYQWDNANKVAHPWLRTVRDALKERRNAFLATGVTLTKIDRDSDYVAPTPSFVLPCVASLAVGAVVGWLLAKRS